MSVNTPNHHGTDRSGDGSSILIVRLGAMGDILHTLPAAASLKHSHPRSRVFWAVHPQWQGLLEGNPFLDGVVIVERNRLSDFFTLRKRLLALHIDVAIDFQGLIKSAVVASLARPDRIYGFHHSELRERAASLFYSRQVQPHAPHIVDKNLELAAAAGASNILHTFPLPPGTPEGELPDGPFILACPLAGWSSKQWPLEHYARLAHRLNEEMGIPLVLNGAPQSRSILESVPGAFVHCSSISGLIAVTRAARAVIGVDSGPLHLAAALMKPGVAIFGPTDPARNGPYGDCFTVLRTPDALITYKRRSRVDESMSAISPDAVFEALKARLSRAASTSGMSV